MSTLKTNWVAVDGQLINLDHVSHILAMTTSTAKHCLIFFYATSGGVGSSGSTTAIEYASLADAQAALAEVQAMLEANSKLLTL